MDLREQLRFTEEEARKVRRQLRQAAVVSQDSNEFEDERDEEESGREKTDKVEDKRKEKNDVNKEESELHMQLESAEVEVCLCCRSISPR